MLTSFLRTTRALAHESSLGAGLALGGALALFGAWGAWFRLAVVPVVETSVQARLEVAGATHPVESSVAGRVLEVRCDLDAEVAAGDVLVRLEAATEQLALDEARAKIGGIAPQLEAVRRQADAERQALSAFREQQSAVVADAETRVREAEIVTGAGWQEAERYDRLFDAQLTSDAERQLTYVEANRRFVAELVVRAQMEAHRREGVTAAQDRLSRVISLEREVASLSAQLGSLEATLPALERLLEQRVIRAPASGRVGEVAGVRVGQVLPAGGHVATIVAPGALRVIASFDPATALGRIRPGQRARVRLNAFPWTEYGALRARVTEVARELHDGQARVELTLEAAGAARVPLQHGLPGKVDVTIEDVSPSELVVRAAGRLGT